MRQAVKLAIAALVVVLVLSGCATKGWVNETLGKKSNEIDERFAKVDARAGDDASRVTQLEGRVSEQSSKLGDQIGQVDQTAKGAQQRADAAMARADEVNQRLSRLWANRHVRNVVETAEVQFAFDRADLSDGAQTTLLGFVKELKANPGLSVDLEGFTDPKGPLNYNYQLSQRRVEAVRRYLVDQGVELPRINSIGRGVLDDRSVPNEKKRRVMLRLMVEPD